MDDEGSQGFQDTEQLMQTMTKNLQQWKRNLSGEPNPDTDDLLVPVTYKEADDVAVVQQECKPTDEGEKPVFEVDVMKCNQLSGGGSKSNQSD